MKERDAQSKSLMQRIRVSGTTPELKVRSKLHRMGLRFRCNRRDLPGKPDIVLPRHRLAIFVHGCFWHGCTQCDRGLRLPKTNAEFWAQKRSSNIARDEAVSVQLKDAGWKISVVWECVTRKEECLDAFLAEVLSYILRQDDAADR